MGPHSNVLATRVWRSLHNTGLERFALQRSALNWLFRGTILTSAAEVRYAISCDGLFRTQAVSVAISDAVSDRHLQLSAHNGTWTQHHSENTSVRGAIDVDLGWTPSTNTLPIRRLNLAIGESSGELMAAWVRFPELTVEPLQQEYLRLSERVYRYSSQGGTFTAELTVDENGLVTNYSGFWELIAS